MDKQFFTKKFFDEFYEKGTKEFREWMDSQRQFLKDNLSEDSIVLDVGCGNGEELKICSKIAKKVVGVDNDQKAIKIAKENIKGLDNVELFLEEGEKMHFEDNTFDVIYIFGNTLGNNGSKKEAIIKEMVRVVKQNGKIWINVWAENAKKIRLEGYKQLNIKIIKSDNGYITVEDGNQEITSEQFDKAKLKKLFDIEGIKVNFIKNLTKYFYICELEKL